MYANHPVPKGEKQTWLAHDGHGWKGALAPELPGIFKWVNVREEPDEAIKEKLRQIVPSLLNVERESEENLNPMLAWVRDELTEGSGAYVGYKPETGAKGLVEGERRRVERSETAYFQWCQKSAVKAVGPRRFSHDLLEVLEKEGFQVEKRHRVMGKFICGISKPKSIKGTMPTELLWTDQRTSLRFHRRRAR
jgi:hypothetical protein